MLNVLVAGQHSLLLLHAVGEVLVLLYVDRVAKVNAILCITNGRAVEGVPERLILLSASDQTNAEASPLESTIHRWLSLGRGGLDSRCLETAVVSAVT